MIPFTGVALNFFENNTMIDLLTIVAVVVIMTAGIIYLEYKVAKMNKAGNEGELAVIMKVLDGLGAKDIE